MSDWIEIVLVIATFLAIFVSLFGKDIHQFIYPIKGDLEIHSFKEYVVNNRLLIFIKVLNKSCKNKYSLEKTKIYLTRIINSENNEIISDIPVQLRYFDRAEQKDYMESNIYTNRLLHFIEYDSIRSISLSLPHAIKGSIELHKDILYHLYFRIDSSNYFHDDDDFIFSLKFKGEWPNNYDLIDENITINKLSKN